eukprot:6986630-Pyramimonas_sp.AAC.2
MPPTGCLTELDSISPTTANAGRERPAKRRKLSGPASRHPADTYSPRYATPARTLCAPATLGPP